MGISNELLNILVCPETKQRVRILEESELKKINVAIVDGRLKNRAGVLVKEKLQAALIREDNVFAYPVRDDIPVMLIEEALDIHSIS